MERFIDVLRIPCRRFDRDNLPWDLLSVYKKGEPTYPHHIIAKELGRKFPLVFTTNFDVLIERAYEQKTGYKIKGTVPSKISGDTRLIKVHGCITAPDSLIVTTAGITRELDPGSVQAIYSAMEERPTLFLGYGGWDDDIRKALKNPDFVPQEIFWFARTLDDVRRNKFLLELGENRNVVFISGDLFLFLEKVFGSFVLEPRPDIYTDHVRSVMADAAINNYFADHVFLYLYDSLDLRDLVAPLFEDIDNDYRSTGKKPPVLYRVNNRSVYARYLRTANRFGKAEKAYKTLLKEDIEYLKEIEGTGEYKKVESDYYLHKEDRAENVGMMMNVLKLPVRILVEKLKILFYFYYYAEAIRELNECYVYRESNANAGALSRIILRINDIKIRRFMHFEDNLFRFLERVPIIKPTLIARRLIAINDIREGYERGLAIAESRNDRQTSSHFYRKLLQVYLYKYKVLNNLNKDSAAKASREEEKEVKSYIRRALEYFNLTARRSAVGYTASIAARYLMYLGEYEKAWYPIFLAYTCPQEPVTKDDIKKTERILRKKIVEPDMPDEEKKFDHLFNLVLGYFE